MSEVQEASQRIQSQALMALAEATQQRGFNPLFNKIAKYDGKDPKKCHYWLNQVWVACMESGRNFCQSLMFCAEDTATEMLERELTEISIPNIRRMPNLPNGMHNFKYMVLMVEQY